MPRVLPLTAVSLFAFCCCAHSQENKCPLGSFYCALMKLSPSTQSTGETTFDGKATGFGVNASFFNGKQDLWADVYQDDADYALNVTTKKDGRVGWCAFHLGADDAHLTTDLTPLNAKGLKCHLELQFDETVNVNVYTVTTELTDEDCEKGKVACPDVPQPQRRTTRSYNKCDAGSFYCAWMQIANDGVHGEMRHYTTFNERKTFNVNGSLYNDRHNLWTNVYADDADYHFNVTSERFNHTGWCAFNLGADDDHEQTYLTPEGAKGLACSITRKFDYSWNTNVYTLTPQFVEWDCGVDKAPKCKPVPQPQRRTKSLKKLMPSTSEDVFV